MRHSHHKGTKVDASITLSSFHSKKPKTFEIAQDRKEDELPEEEIEKQEHFFKEMAEDGVDKGARWLKKEIFCLKSSRKKRYKKEHNFEFSTPHFLKKIIRI